MNKILRQCGIFLACLMCVACPDTGQLPGTQSTQSDAASKSDTSGQPGTSGQSGTPAIPGATAPWLTFNYESLGAYRSGAPSLTVDSMPDDLKGALDACLYTGPYGRNGSGWYLHPTMEAATGSAAQAFFTGMAAYVNTTCGTDDFRKIKMIHDWIVDYLDYNFDMQFYKSNDQPSNSQSATNILRRGIGFNNARHGEAVCYGYAQLFRAFAEKLIPLDNTITRHWVIDGWAGAPTDARCGGPNIKSTHGVPTNHAWNQIEINGNVYSVDCTWDDSTCGFGPGVSYRYLFASPLDMIKDHIPKYFDSQLLDNDNRAPWDDTIVTWEEYEAAYRP